MATAAVRAQTTFGEQRIAIHGISWEICTRLVEKTGDQRVHLAYNRGSWNSCRPNRCISMTRGDLGVWPLWYGGTGLALRSVWHGGLEGWADAPRT